MFIEELLDQGLYSVDLGVFEAELDLAEVFMITYICWSILRYYFMNIEVIQVAWLFYTFFFEIIEHSIKG